MATIAAVPKIAGYIFQFHRALYRLFSSESASTVIGVETDDDVVSVVRHADGSADIEFEQDKYSAQDAGQPFQDKSKNLWHTMHVWLEAIEQTRKNYENVSFCLVTNKEVSDRALAQRLSDADDEEEIEDCVIELRRRALEVIGTAAKSAAAVAGFSDDKLIFLISNMQLLDEHGTSTGATPRQATIQLLQLPPIWKHRHLLSTIACSACWLNPAVRAGLKSNRYG